MNEYEERARERKVAQILSATELRWGTASAAQQATTGWTDSDWRRFAHNRSINKPSEAALSLVRSHLRSRANQETAEYASDRQGMG